MKYAQDAATLSAMGYTWLDGGITDGGEVVEGDWSDDALLDGLVAEGWTEWDINVALGTWNRQNLGADPWPLPSADDLRRCLTEARGS